MGTMREELKDAAEQYLLRLNEGGIFGAEFRRGDIKAAFEAGYKHAKKDLALTWEDIKQIDLCFHSVATEHTLGRLEMSSFRQMYEEVLRRFQEFKNNK